MPSHVDRPLVYVAGPYQHPDPVANTTRAVQVGDDLNATGIVTSYVPHMSLLWHLIRPHTAEWWYDFDLAILARCDSLYRIDGHSPGAENEVSFAGDRGIPIFYERDDLLEWARGYSAN